MKRLARLLDPVRAGHVIAMIGIVAIMLLVTFDVLARNLVGTSFTGTLEISEFLQGIAVFLGLAMTLRTGSHIAADLIVERLSPRRQAWFDLATSLLSLLVFGLMSWALFSIALERGADREISEILGWPTQPIKLLAGVGVALMCAEIVGNIVRHVRTLRAGGA
ncbi:MAG: TRAP transporter small permease [Burkholderiaceae bacterium]